MIKIITRVRYRDLYERMLDSAANKSGDPTQVKFVYGADDEGLPHIAKTYNALARGGDYYIFCHDDVVFLEDGWDEKLLAEFESTGADILGPVGRDSFGVSSEGKHCFGKFAGGNLDEIDMIKVLSGKCENKKVDVVDGMFMAVRGSFFDLNKFDERFDELWFYADDLCLRGKTYISDILVAHHKPEKYYGKYPENMKPVTDYLPLMAEKWGLTELKAMSLNERCAQGPLKDFLEVGQDRVYGWLIGKYAEV